MHRLTWQGPDGSGHHGLPLPVPVPYRYACAAILMAGMAGSLLALSRCMRGGAAAGRAARARVASRQAGGESRADAVFVVHCDTGLQGTCL